MKGVVATYGTVEDEIELLTARYRAAFHDYQWVLNRNTDIWLNGGQTSVQSLVDEERAFEALDCARHALLAAAERAYPTIH
jgi:hypothetical protein